MEQTPRYEEICQLQIEHKKGSFVNLDRRKSLVRGGSEHVCVGHGRNRYSFLDPVSFPAESKYVFLEASFSSLKRKKCGSDWGDTRGELAAH